MSRDDDTNETSSSSREEAGERPMRFSNTDVGGIVLLPGQRTSPILPTLRSGKRDAAVARRRRPVQARLKTNWFSMTALLGQGLLQFMM